LGPFYRDVVSPYFPAGARLVIDRYEAIRLPGTPIDPGNFYVSVNWNYDQMVAFIRSWSGTQEYMKQRGKDPVGLIVSELERFWGDRSRVLTARWPLYMRIARL